MKYQIYPQGACFYDSVTNCSQIRIICFRSFEERWEFKHIDGRGKTTIAKSPPPHNITIHKGDAHVTLSREMVEYIVTDPVALEFREWVKDAYCPEEIFFASLQYNPHLKAPGYFNCE
jgi:beta-1,3-galactosyl-O-glycosyl-glycoprotein beta-1,6-N-acetylglucosaminyltransferase/N-acetyllactosaminide beta-1,6-N-acetylglucosaminyltransferase